MKKERMREIASGVLTSLIVLDFENGIGNFGCRTIEEYCIKVLEATREEVEEIIKRDIEDLDSVQYWIKNQIDDEEEVIYRCTECD
jgi:CO dehydrogenase nickel-insertion accessory protein CooC1